MLCDTDRGYDNRLGQTGGQNKSLKDLGVSREKRGRKREGAAEERREEQHRAETVSASEAQKDITFKDAYTFSFFSFNSSPAVTGSQRVFSNLVEVENYGQEF